MSYNIGDIFTIDEEYALRADWCNNNNCKIEDIGEGKYTIVEIPQPTIEEQNELIRQTRENLYMKTSDVIRNDYLEAVARGAENAEQLKQEWLASKDKIREENPYIDIVD